MSRTGKSDQGVASEYICVAYPVSNHLVDSSADAPEAGSFPVDFRHGSWFDSGIV